MRFMKLFSLIVVVVVIMVFGLFQVYKTNQKNFANEKEPGKLAAAPYEGNPAPSIQLPSISLTDQNGNKIRLTDFKGKVVVVTFFDAYCTDTCPLTAQEFLQSYKSLGNKAQDVVFLAVNVNAEHNKVQDVQKFSEEQGLNRIPNWHFLTGTPDELKQIWKLFYVDVSIGPDGDINHTSVMYFMDRQGKVVWLLSNLEDKSAIEESSHLITKKALDLL